MLIIRLPLLGNSFEIRSSGFVLTATQSYLYDKSAATFEAIGSRFDGPCRTLDPQLDRLLKRFNDYPDRVADLEERLYANRAGKEFMTEWMGLKRDLVRIERVMMRAAETLCEMMEHYAETADFPIDSFADPHEHADRIHERMNRIVYLLTVISAIFLPLNPVVGFFGMNTGGLPFAQSDSGTIRAVTLMVSLLIATGLGLLWWQARDRRKAS